MTDHARAMRFAREEATGHLVTPFNDRAERINLARCYIEQHNSEFATRKRMRTAEAEASVLRREVDDLVGVLARLVQCHESAQSSDYEATALSDAQELLREYP